MGPYRHPMSTLTPRPAKQHKRWYAHVGLGFLLASFASMNLLERFPGFWPVPVCGTGLAIVILAFGQARTRATTRLARIAWHHGDWFGAVTLYLGMATLLYSRPQTPKSIARTRAALNAAQVGMPKFHTLSSLVFPSERDDDERS